MDPDTVAADAAVAPEDAHPAPASDAAPAPEQHDAEPQTDGDAEGTQTEGDAEQEEVEFDFGGKKLRVSKAAIPAEVAEELDRFTKGTWSDYTKKSQEVAEQRKALETERSVVQRLGTLRHDQLATYAKGLQVAEYVAQLEKVDLSGLWQSNPDQARRVSDDLARARAEYASIEAKVGEFGSAINAEQQKAEAAAAEAGRRKVAAAIKGFTPQVEAEVVDYAVKTYGIPREVAATWPHNPDGFVMAHKAMLYDRMQARAAQAAKPAAPAVAAPVVPVRARAAPSAKDPEKMSDSEWLAWRNQQLAKRRG